MRGLLTETVGEGFGQFVGTASRRLISLYFVRDVIMQNDSRLRNKVDNAVIDTLIASSYRLTLLAV